MVVENKKKAIRKLKNKMEALIMAIPNEENSYDNYMEMANSYDDKASKEMFTFLANEELMHKKKLEMMLAKLENELKGLESSND